MANHRLGMDRSQYPGRIDLTGLRPATVEELAAQERAKPARAGRGRRPLMIAVATCLLLTAGAGALAMARTESTPRLVQPYGDAAPFGVGYVDGFGEHSPEPSRKPRTTTSRKPRTTAPASIDNVVLLPSAGLDVEVLQPQASAVYWMNTWNSTTYEAYVWVSNESDGPLDWQVSVQLPAGATVTTSMAVDRSYKDGVWTFTSTRGELRAGHVYLFAFSGKRSSSRRFSLISCDVNGVACIRFG